MPPSSHFSRSCVQVPSYQTYIDALIKHSQRLRYLSMSPTRNLTVVNTERYINCLLFLLPMYQFPAVLHTNATWTNIEERSSLFMKKNQLSRISTETYPYQKQTSMTATTWPGSSTGSTTWCKTRWAGTIWNPHMTHTLRQGLAIWI